MTSESMATTLLYLNNRVPCEDGESDEPEVEPSTAAIDCNRNAGAEGVKDAADGVQKSASSSGGVKIVKNENVDGGNNNEKVPVSALPPPSSSKEGQVTEGKSSELTGSNTGSSQNVREGSPEADTSGTASNAENNKISVEDKMPAEMDDEGSSSDNVENNNGKKSYAEIKSKRKTLLKIEKLTDSDNRTRSKMRRRALSPPSSSDEENLYIGWIAYPASSTSLRRSNRNRKRREVWMKAVKFIFSPVTKSVRLCQKCVKNKVGIRNAGTAESEQ